MERKNHNVDELALDRHAVLEASAGTGKTYTLERLVLRLLIQKRVPLDEILLVTYTEKATGELRGRLRATLQKELDAAGEHRSCLQEALRHFDQAPIFTIHAFCQNVLQEYAFDQRHDFRTRLVDDGEVLQSCLREIQRRQWPAEYGAELRAVLELSGYGASWEDKVLALAERVRPACGHRLLPEVAATRLPLGELDREVRAARVRLNALLGPWNGAPADEHPLLRAYARLTEFKTHEDRARFILLPALAWLTDPDADARPAESFCELIHRCANLDDFRKGGFAAAISKLSKGDRVERLPAPLTEVLDLLESLRRSAIAVAPPHHLAVRTVEQLQQAMAAYKREHGLISFEDMLTRVDEGIDVRRNPRATDLIDALRRRYRYAIVDEFQDTDPLQWRILRRLFVEAEGGRLFVVGDPKQAIFSFRGADFHTYGRAVRELKGSHDAAACALDVNWRSSQELLEGLNHLFGHGEWFAGDYAEVRPTSDAQARSAFVDDDPERAALTLVHLGGEQKSSQAQHRYARFCAGEIRRLLQAAPRIRVRGDTRPLVANDICLLLHRRADANCLVEELTAAGIPFSFYKQTGLWQSEEARHVACLLKALARPDERQSLTRALLTRFFRVPPEELAQCEDLSPRHPARLLFQDWADLAGARKWARLFHSMLDECGLLQRQLAAPDGERRLANYRHILQYLEQAAYGRGLDVFGLIELLQSRHDARNVDETNVQPVETERQKVQILTIHASKGLEYPIVFVAGGFARPKEGLVSYRADEESVVFHLHPEQADKIKARAEREAEVRRLYYVALTRAMLRVYVPWLDVDSKRSGGPLVSLVAPALAKSRVDQLGPPVATRIECPPWQPRSPIVSLPAPLRATVLTSPMEIDDPEVVFPRVAASLSARRIVLRSFSSIHRQLALAAEDAAKFGERPYRAEDEEPESAAEADPLRGPVFGDMVHAVLEQVDFAAVGRAATPEALLETGGPLDALLEEQLTRNLLRLRSRVSGAALAQLCREQIARLVWGALRTPLDALGGPLWQVPPEDRLHELEFHFPERDIQPPPPEIQREEGFLTGIMDLVVRRRGRYFLVDWKTNYLAGYTAAEIEQAMADCDYVRQSRLYLQALARWLKRERGPEFRFERDFGGVFYLFLRGLNGRDQSSGVYAHPPSADDLRLDLVLGQA